MYDAKVESKGMHFAKIENSPRLQRVIELLRDGQEHTTREIQNKAEVCAVNAIMGELRLNGFDIPPSKCLGKNESGAMVYTYWLKKGGEEAA